MSRGKKVTHEQAIRKTQEAPLTTEQITRREQVSEIASFYEQTDQELLAQTFRVDCFGLNKFVINSPDVKGRKYYVEYERAGGCLGNLARHAPDGELFYHEYGMLYSAEELWNSTINEQSCPASLFINNVYDHEGNELDFCSVNLNGRDLTFLQKRNLTS